MIFGERQIQVPNITILLVGVALFISGCPRAEAPEAKRTDPVILSEGIITAKASRFFESGSEEPFEQFEIVGVFPRFDLEKIDVVDSLLGSRVPQSDDLALDMCSSPAPVLGSRARRSADDETAIELIDVGDVSLEYRGVRRAVPTRTFPDLLKVIDGVIYSANESRGVHFLPGETYTFRATGTDEVDQFDVVLDAPDDLGDVKLDGDLLVDHIPIIRRGHDLEISWEGEGYGDEVIATVNWTSMGLPWSMMCRMRDDGYFVIPDRLTDGMYDPLASDDHEMSLSRIRQVSFRSAGLSSGEFLFVVSTNFLVGFESAQ